MMWKEAWEAKRLYSTCDCEKKLVTNVMHLKQKLETGKLIGKGHRIKPLTLKKPS